MDEDLKRNLRESLVYAVYSSVKDRTAKRLLVSEFFHSLNRKGFLLNYEVEDMISKAYDQLKELEG